MPTPPRRRSSHQTETTVPVRVVAASRPAAPPIPMTKSPVKSVPRTIPAKRAPAPAAAPRAPWPEAKKRQMMWLIVASGTAIIILGWLAIMRYEFGGNHGPNLFADITNSFKNFSLTKPKPAPNPEVRTLERQVFPQFAQ